MEVGRVGVVGLGAMGAGIAQLSIEAGIETVGCELSAELGERARGQIEYFLNRKVEKGKLGEPERDAAIARFELATDIAAVAGCDFVVEAVVEELEPKRDVFRRLEQVCRADAVLATNTSALSVAEIAEAVQTPARVVGMHFFNPAPLMPLVEVVRAPRSSDDAVETTAALAERLGKEVVRCNDTPAFVVNRVLIPLLNDCVRVLDEANVSPEDLDTAMKAGVGWPMGPCELLDLVGLDVHVHASEALYARQPEPRFEPPPRLVAMVAEGRLGRKGGRGFYEY